MHEATIILLSLKYKVLSLVDQHELNKSLPKVDRHKKVFVFVYDYSHLSKVFFIIFFATLN